MLILLLGCAAPEVPAGRYSAVGVADAGTLYLVGGATTGGKSAEVWAWTEAGGWVRRPDAPAPIFRATAVPLGGVVWVFGGSGDGNVDLDTLYRWTPAGDAWEQVTPDGPGPAPRYKHTAAAWGDQMVVVGGRNDDADPAVVYDDAWTWDPATNAWQSHPGMGTIYREGLAVDADGTLWLQGGIDGDDVRHDWLWTWDGTTWTQQPDADPRPDVRASHSFVALDDALWLWGGHGTDTDVWRLDPVTQTWADLPADPAPAARDAQVTVLDDGLVYVIGGDSASADLPDFLNDVWSYDPATGAWTERFAATE